MNIIKPSFLQDVKQISKKETIHLTSHMRNWVVLAHSIKNLSEEDLKKMILLEIEGKRRIQIIQRLKSRFNTLRLKRENIELTSIRTSRNSH